MSKGQKLKKAGAVAISMLLFAVSCFVSVFFIMHVESIKAQPVSFGKDKGYCIISDKQYTADCQVEYEYNGSMHNGTVEVDSRLVGEIDSISVRVLSGSGRMIPDGILVMPFFLAVTFALCIAYSIFVLYR